MEEVEESGSKWWGGNQSLPRISLELELEDGGAPERGGRSSFFRLLM